MRQIFISLMIILLSPHYAHADLMNGLVGWWKFDEGSGVSLTDSSGQGHTATTHNTSWTTGKFKNGLNFNGTNTYVDSGSRLGNYTTGDGSICMWAYHINAYNSGVDDGLFDAQGSGEIQMLRWHDNNLYFGFPAGGRVSLAATAQNWPQNQWSQYCVTWVSGGTTTAYFNGKSIGSSGGTSVNNPTDTIQFGTWGPQATYYTGRLDDVRIYNRVLTATEVNDLYQQGQGHVSYGINSVIGNSKTSF